MPILNAIAKDDLLPRDALAAIIEQLGPEAASFFPLLEESMLLRLEERKRSRTKANQSLDLTFVMLDCPNEHSNNTLASPTAMGLAMFVPFLDPKGVFLM